MKNAEIRKIAGWLWIAAIALAAFSATAKETKFIAHGWDCQSASPQDVLASADLFDKTPLDGVSLSIKFTNSEANVYCYYKTMMTDPEWRWRDVEFYVPVLKEIVKHKSLRESLLSAFRCPKVRLDWRDDAAWARFANNMRILARLAREGGVKGIMIDPEDYPRTKQFYMQKGDAAYDETVALARRRGREVFGAVFEEKPDITILAFWLLSTDKEVYRSSDPAAAMRQNGCLFPAFMDGLMDVLPPAATLVDGNESTYRCEAPYRDHITDAWKQKLYAVELLSRENRAKYLLQHRTGAGFFLDGYWRGSDDKWYAPPFNGTRADRLGLNLAAAAEAVDYVWLDGEYRLYVPWRRSDEPGFHMSSHFLRRETWSDIIPGFWKEVAAAKDPLSCDYGRRVNVGSAPAATLKNAKTAVAVRNAKYGEIYEVCGSALAQGAYVRVDWKCDGGEKWAGRAERVLVTNGRAVFRVPQGVDSFSVVCNPARAADGVAGFTEIKVNRLEILSDDERALTAAEDELHKYWKAITGGQEVVPVRLAIDPKISKSGNDAYEMVSSSDLRFPDKAKVTITGSNGRSVLYGVYDLLERRGGCAWFWDGDKIPKKRSIDVTGLDVHEESKFRYRGIRYFAHRGLMRFQAEHWGPEEWKREIDWCLKKRLNLFMLRIGQDDLFQKAFPGTCAYPDAGAAIPGQGARYDNRSLFWPLEYRGELRKEIMDYAFARGMMAPEDFGTMTHWYSRTPQDFIDKMKPDYLPQSTGAYGEPSGLVWDIRKKKWMDAYWRLTDTAIREYGREGLLHTIGIAERRVTENRAENLRLKTTWTDMLLGEAKRRHPTATRLLAGWDMYCMKEAGEVKRFLAGIPEDVVIWDYEADAYMNTNFTEWDVIGKRPYTFGVFMALEAGLDMRTDYDLIAARQRLVADDPMCKGYILWPESSHTDSLGLEWFARNSWRADRPDVRALVEDYCKSRYPAEAKVMAGLWLSAIPVSTNMQERWRRNAFLTVMREFGEGIVRHAKNSPWPAAKPDSAFAGWTKTAAALKSLDWERDEFLRRDMTDIARVWADRLAVEAENRMVLAYLRWLGGDESARQEVLREGKAVRERLAALAGLLALHPDFSICDTYERLRRIHPITNPGFASVLVDNAANFYCASHQAELAAHCYLPAFDAYLKILDERMRAGNRTPPEKNCLEEFRRRAMKMGFDELRLNAPRTRDAFNKALDAITQAKQGEKQ